MANGKFAFQTGMLLGAAAGAFYVVATRRWLEGKNEMVDWDQVQEVAIRTSGRTPLATPWTSHGLRSSYEEMVQRLEGPISEYTHSSLPSAGTSVTVMGRREWIEANVDGFRTLFGPVEEMYREIGHQSAVVVPGLQRLSQMAVSGQMGLLLGYLSRRVLGQYDMSLLGREPMSSGKLYFVQQNIEGIETQLGIPPEEFRAWITLHESTHAHEFEAFPWLRDYMNHTLRAYLDCVLQEMRKAPSNPSGAAAGLVARMAENIRSGRSLLEAVMSRRQQRYMGSLQSLMCLLEGYSNHVMNAVGRSQMPHFEEIKSRVDSRSGDRAQSERLFLKLTGLSMKMEQYRLGEKFVDRVVKERDIRFVNQAYQGPENLPTMDEILHPGKWIARMERDN